MRIKLYSALLTIVLLTVGCASKPVQQALSVNAGLLNDKTAKIGVAIEMPEKVDTYFPGADCLLCYATASMANSSLTKHVQTLSGDEFKAVGDDLVALLKKKGMNVKLVTLPSKIKDLSDSSGQASNAARKNFNDVMTKLDVDKLLVVQVNSLGVTRNYASYIATGEPKASVNGLGYIVNKTNNVYEWYLPVGVTRSASGKWDEAPKYPGLTNAYYQAIEAAKDLLKEPFQ